MHYEYKKDAKKLLRDAGRATKDGSRNYLREEIKTKKLFICSTVRQEVSKHKRINTFKQQFLSVSNLLNSPSAYVNCCSGKQQRIVTRIMDQNLRQYELRCSV